MPTLFEIRLKSIKLLENGTVDKNKDGTNALGAILSYPRPGIPAVNALRPLKLHDNVGVIFTGKPYNQQVLFKEAVRGQTMLTLEVSAIDEPSRIDKVVSGLLGTAVSVAAGGIGAAIVGAVASSLSGSIFEAIGPKKKVAVIARGSSEGVFEFNEGFPGGEVTIPLQVPQRLTFHDMKIGPDRKPSRTKLTLEKGAPNGKVVLDIRKLED